VLRLPTRSRPAQVDGERRLTAEQAKSGERAFQAKCATCHGSDLHSTDAEAPDLTEGAFKFGWEGKTVANRFEQIRGSMPLGNARSLDDQTYIDIVAYILAFNGIPPGNQSWSRTFALWSRLSSRSLRRIHP